MRKYHLFLFSIFFICFSCKEKTQKQPEEKAAAETSKVVMLPKAISFVSDHAHILTTEQIIHLDSIIAKHEMETTNQVALITYNIAPLQIKTDEAFNEFSTNLFNELGVGQKDKNNGVGFLICPDVKRVRIAVGKGLESKLTNPETQHIIDSFVVPAFKQGSYFNGMSKGLEAIFSEIK